MVSAVSPVHRDAYQLAVDARDPRFDGVFFVGITTTHVYCRPVCRSRLAYDSHRRFFDSAAAAERAGFRPCLRCRPELAPGRAALDAVSQLAHEATQRIAAGALNGRNVATLARDLGVCERLPEPAAVQHGVSGAVPHAAERAATGASRAGPGSGFTAPDARVSAATRVGASPL